MCRHHTRRACCQESGGQYHTNTRRLISQYAPQSRTDEAEDVNDGHTEYSLRTDPNELEKYYTHIFLKRNEFIKIILRKYVFMLDIQFLGPIGPLELGLSVCLSVGSLSGKSSLGNPG